MTLMLFTRVLHNLPVVKVIVLTGWGEPLMHERFEDLLVACGEIQPQARLQFTTNGNLLVPKVFDRLKKHSNLSQITISIDSLDAQIKQGHKFSVKVKENLLEVCSHKAPTLKIVLQTLLFATAKPEIKKIIDLAGRFDNIAVNLVRLDVRDGRYTRPDLNTEQRLIKSLQKYGRKNNVVVNAVNKQNWLQRLASHQDNYCLRSDDYLYVNVNGQATPCCGLRNFVLGDLSVQSWQDIWRGQRRNGFLKKQAVICGGCDALYYRHKH
jgi:MoaA/NifB/PqqE/SkfB family radical SAM enzyme